MKKLISVLMFAALLFVNVGVSEAHHSTVRGTVTFIFDDGNRSVFEKATPIFEKHGVSGGLGIFTTGIGSGGRMTAAELTTMRSKGWEILSHSVTHTSLRDKTEADIQYELAKSKEILNSYGLIVNGFVAPYSFYPQEHMTLAQESYKFMLQGYVDSRTEPAENLMATYSNPYGLIRANMQYKTLDELKAIMEYAHNNGKWLIFYEHRIDELDYTTSETLDALVSYAKTLNMNIKPPSKVYGYTY